MTLWHAHVETRHWDFDAYGETEALALQTLKEGWLTHCTQTHATMTWDELRDDVCVNEIHTGQCYRDGEELLT